MQVVSQTSLNPEQYTQVLALQQHANQLENLDLKLSLDDNPLADAPYLRHHLCVEQQKIIGYGSIAGIPELPELCLVIDPLYQGKGYGTQLLHTMMQHSQHVPKRLLICERNALKSRAWVKSLGLTLDNTEHRQVLDFFHYTALTPNIDTRKATLADVPEMVKGLNHGFKNHSTTPEHVSQELQNPQNECWIMLHNTTMCAGVKLFFTEQRVGIYGLWVAENMQGQGYGTQFMQWILGYLQHKTPQAWLEVSSDNQIALKLYRKLGFVDTVVYEYYGL